MNEGLLRTKLYAPSPRRNLVTRTRLLDKLAEALYPEVRLTLVCAPAGFGKTTIVTEWLSRLGQSSQTDTSQPGMKSAWLTLDELDNDPIRFWRYVDAALQSVDSRLGESIHPVLYAPQPPPFRSLVAELANDLLTVGLEFVLVLDDYHHIQNESVHETIDFLIDFMPPLVHPVLITRSDPPLQLARRRARGELCELRAADLRFTNDETTQFINEVMGLDLSVKDVDDLDSRTEGWIAGLQMAAITLQDVTDAHAFVSAFRGNDRYIADYLLEEVLQRQPVEFQQFLLQTAVLDRLCAQLCNAITGRKDSQAVLNALERANLFITPLDNHRQWFRYHHLFASLLQQRQIDTAGPAAVVDLKRRASQWHAAHGNIVDSVEIAISCGDYEQAVSVIKISDAALFMGPELNTLCQWLERIPAEVIGAHPRLNLMSIWASHATGNIQQAERFLRLLEQSAGVSVEEFLDHKAGSSKLTSIQRSALLEGSVARARLAVDSLELDKTFSLGERTLPRLVNTPSEPFAFNPPGNLRCVMLFELGLAYEFHGDPVTATKLFSEAEMDAVVMKNPHIIALAMGHLGRMQILQDQKQQAFATFQRAIEAAKTFPPRSSAFWGLAEIGLGELAFAISDLEAAKDHFQAGLEQGKMWNNWESLLPGMLGLARLSAAEGDLSTAFSILNDLLERTTLDAIIVRPAVEAQRAEFYLMQGDLDVAAQWASAFDALHPAVYRLQWEQSALIAAKILLAQGKQAEAESLLARLLAEAELAGRKLTVRQIHQLDRDPVPASNHKSQAGDLVDPLSEREMEVLRLMANGLSNPEIARKLVLSPNTLKAHARNIYHKLSTHNRMEAVNKARELHLL
ncbi:MAG TPA: LuxR C-terminal-related transcriptional regulator [Anaerolineales bacterium]|nr:LuxR C-terminal-related transcriptional regulator [Anaerolineales bacterium]